MTEKDLEIGSRLNSRICALRICAATLKEKSLLVRASSCDVPAQISVNGTYINVPRELRERFADAMELLQIQTLQEIVKLHEQFKLL